MRVLFTFGGMPHYLIKLLNLIQEKGGIEVVVVMPASEGKTIGKGVKQDNSGIQFKQVFLPETTTYFRKPFFAGFLNTVKAEKPDIIVTCWPYILGFVLYPRLWFYIKRENIKLAIKEIPFWVPLKGKAISYYKANPVYSEEMVYEKTSGFKFYLNVLSLDVLRRLYYKALDATFIYTEEGQAIEASYGVKPKNIFVTYNSPDTDALLAAKKQIESEMPILPPNQHRLLHVGRLVQWKRVDLLIRSFAAVHSKYPDSELVIIGNGPQEEELRKLVTHLQLESYVRFVGGVYDTVTLGKYFTDATIYVLAGMGGLSINEAMAFNKPVICSVCDGTEKHLVFNGENGLYFEDGNETDLTSKIEYLFEHPELIEKMGLRSGEIIRNNVNIHTMVNKYIEGFRKLAEKY